MPHFTAHLQVTLNEGDDRNATAESIRAFLTKSIHGEVAVSFSPPQTTKEGLLLTATIWWAHTSFLMDRFIVQKEEHLILAVLRRLKYETGLGVGRIHYTVPSYTVIL